MRHGERKGKEGKGENKTDKLGVGLRWKLESFAAVVSEAGRSDNAGSA